MASCIRVQLNSSSFSIIYWSTLVFSLPSLQSDREQSLFMGGTSRKYFHFNSRQTLLHSSVTLSHTSCQPCIIDTWIFLSPPTPSSLIIQPTRRPDKPGQACVIYAPKHNVAVIHLRYLRTEHSLCCAKTAPRTEEGFLAKVGATYKHGHLCSFVSIAC